MALPNGTPLWNQPAVDVRTGRWTRPWYDFFRNILATGGIGTITGPSTGVSTDTAIVRWDGATGLVLQDSGITIADGASGTLAGTNSGDVTLAGTPDYLTIAAQVLTLGLIDLATDVTGDLPYANLTQAGAASRLLGRGSASGAGDWQDISLGAGLTMTGTTLAASASAPTESVGITIDGGGSAITTGVKGYVEVPYACTITAVRMLADQSGSAVVDIWKQVYASYPPVDANSITASAVPTISGAIKSEDTTLTGWTTSISAGDILGFNVDSAATITRLTLQLSVTRT